MPRTLLFVHGNFVNARCWDGWVERFSARGLRCLAPAYPGRDDSVERLRRSPDRALLGSLTIGRVVDHFARAIATLEEKPIVIGHSFGGLLTQLLVQRGLAAAAVAIDSVPPAGVLAKQWSFYKSTAPVLNPLRSASNPYLMSFRHWQYTFTNGHPPEEQRASYDRLVVPESRRLARGALGPGGRIDFAKPHAPLLLIAGERDHIMPAELNRRNFRRYSDPGSITAFRMFPGRTHYSVIAGEGWEDVADFALGWAMEVTGGETIAAAETVSSLTPGLPPEMRIPPGTRQPELR